MLVNRTTGQQRRFDGHFSLHQNLIQNLQTYENLIDENQIRRMMEYGFSPENQDELFLNDFLESDWEFQALLSLVLCVQVFFYILFSF